MAGARDDRRLDQMAHEKAFDGVPTLREFIAFVYERSFEPCVLEACNEVMLAMENPDRVVMVREMVRDDSN